MSAQTTTGPRPVRWGQVAVAGLLAAAGGCGPSVVLPSPGGVPRHLAGRSLFNTPHALVYATSKAAAGEADRLVRQVARDFEADTGRRPPRGVVIVTDTYDAPFADAQARWLVLKRHMGSFPADGSLSLVQRPGQWDQDVRQFRKLGVDPDTYVGVSACALAADDMNLLGLSDGIIEAAEWGLAIPTQAMATRGVWGMLNGMADRAEASPLRRIAAAPVMLAAAAVMEKRPKTWARIALYARWVWTQTDLPAERREALARAYWNRQVRTLPFGALTAE